MPTDQSDPPGPYHLTISLSVLRHLGINLYSNVPAVLAEIVANAWDADAHVVRVDWNKASDTITIEDDGSGMSPSDINARFLTVGYRRRDGQPGLTDRGRKPMGRKGIGKLSLFSIANSIDIETAKGGVTSAFRMELADIEREIANAEREKRAAQYSPRILGNSAFANAHGTRITLRELKKRQTIKSPDYLRTRIARRFSVVGPSQHFEVYVDGTAVLPRDRGYYDKVQYLWTYGEQQTVESLCTALERHEPRDEHIATSKLTVTGWLGTVKRANALKDDYGDNLNHIALYVRGKVAQEDLLGDFSERGVYANYLIGELHVDELDSYDGEGEEDEDAATSSRQQIVEGDERYGELGIVVHQELRNIQLKWAAWRGEAGMDQAMEIPELNRWAAALTPDARGEATKWIGRLYRIRMDSEESRKEMLKHTVLAFEVFSAKGVLHALDSIDDSSWPGVLDAIGRMDSLEAMYYGEIVSQRVGVIRTLRKLVDANELEKVVQQYLFQHLWLLDPAWERVEGSEVMERSMKTIFAQTDKEVNGVDLTGRLDIRYRKTAGQHVIVELKRPGIRVSLLELLNTQIEKYYEGALAALTQQGIGNETVDIVLVLGKDPMEWASTQRRERALGSLGQYRARVLFYDQLLYNAEAAYRDYLLKEKKGRSIRDVLNAIEDFAYESGELKE